MVSARSHGGMPSVPSVLVVNPDPRARTRIVAVLSDAQFDVSACASATEALALLRIAPRDAMVVDATLDAASSTDILDACAAAGVAPATIMTTAKGEIGRAVTALRDGYRDYVPAPFDERLAQALREALAGGP